jgi:hypothetical protein
VGGLVGQFLSLSLSLFSRVGCLRRWGNRGVGGCFFYTHSPTYECSGGSVWMDGLLMEVGTGVRSLCFYCVVFSACYLPDLPRVPTSLFGSMFE